MTATTRIQLRGICQCCGREQAVVGGYMAKHGYTVKDGWFQGVCSGNSYAPMQISRERADLTVREVRAECVELRALVADLTSGKKRPAQAKSGNWKLERHPKLGYMERVDVMVPFKEAPKHEQQAARDALIWQTTRRAEIGESFADSLERRADEYHGKPLREVNLDADKPEPIKRGERRLIAGGTAIATVNSVDGARVHWTTPSGNDRQRHGWTGTAAWRRFPKVTTEEKA